MIQLLQKDNPTAFSPMGGWGGGGVRWGLSAHTRKRKKKKTLELKSGN